MTLHPPPRARVRVPRVPHSGLRPRRLPDSPRLSPCQALGQWEPALSEWLALGRVLVAASGRRAAVLFRVISCCHT